MSDKQSITHFGNYEVIERISAGGMAEIFKAKKEGLGGFQRMFAHQNASWDEIVELRWQALGLGIPFALLFGAALLGPLIEIVLWKAAVMPGGLGLGVLLGVRQGKKGPQQKVVTATRSPPRVRGLPTVEMTSFAPD